MISVTFWARAGTALAAMAFAHAASGQVAPATADASAAADDQGRDTIIVTGTRRTDRTVTESAVPVDVFSAGDLASQSTSDIKAAIKNLVPSFNLQRNALFDGSAFVRPPTLRGLPPDETLVLVNGKRVHRSALVQVSGGSLAAGSQSADLSQIPAAAIERVEVLRDGAAAQYGSDAIAGVLNFGLKRNAHGLELNARYGEYYEGDGRDIQLSGNLGLKLGDQGGFINLTAEYVNANDTDRAVQRPDAVVLESQGYAVKRPVTRFGSPDTESYRFFVNAELPLGDRDALYVFGNYGHSDQVIDFNYRRPKNVTVTGPTGAAQTLGKSVAIVYLDRNTDGTWNADGRTWDNATLFPNGFTPRFRSTNTDVSAVGGYRGETGFGLKYDASLGYGQNRIKYYIFDTINPSLGPDTPTSFYAGSLEQRELNANLDLTYPVEVGLASPLNIAGGLEWRRESFLIGAGDRASYEQGIYAAQTVRRADGTTFLVTHAVGSNGFPGYGPTSIVDRSRASYAAYLDLEVDVTPRFTLGGAVRYEHYQDFGGTTNVKATARYAISDAVALRGAASTGFRAPTPGQLYLRNLQTTFVGSNPVQVATLSPEDPAAKYYKATALSPEESVNFSGGIVLTPSPAFTVTWDYYNIKVTNRIGLTSRFDVTAADRVALAAAGVVDPNSLGAVQYFTNGFATRTQGADFVASYRANPGWGKLTSQFAVNYNRTRLIDRRTITLADGRTAQLIDDVRKRDIETLLPRWRGVFTQTAEVGRFDLTARANYFGKFTNNQTGTATTGNGGNKTFGSEVSFDLEVGVRIADKFRIAVGGENIFDNYPDRETRLIYPSTNAPSSGFIYPDGSPLGVLGGFWYVRLSAGL